MIINYFKINAIKKNILPVIFIFFLLPYAIFAQYINLKISASENFNMWGIEVADHEVVKKGSDGNWAKTAANLSSALPLEVDINAIDFINDMKAYFCIDAPAIITDKSFAGYDIILWSGAYFYNVFNGITEGLPEYAKIDALEIVSETPFEFCFSLDSSAYLTIKGNSVLVEDEDVVRYKGGEGFTEILFDGSANGIDERADLDAIAQIDEHNWLFSFDTPLAIGLFVYDDSDLIKWNSLTGTFEASVWFIAASNVIGENVDINAIDFPMTTPTPTPTLTPTETPTPSPTPDVTQTATPSPTPDITPTPEFTATPTIEPSPTPEFTPTATATPNITPTPEFTATPTPTIEATPTPELTPTPVPTAEPTPTPINTATPTPIPQSISGMFMY